MTKSHPRILICNGDANSYVTHGGLPFNLFKEGRNQGLIDHAASLNYKKIKHWKYVWNIFQLLKFGKPGGFQYSQFYARKMIEDLKLSSDSSINILSIYPLLPSYPWPEKWNIDFYIDFTTAQIFTEYSSSDLISEGYKRKVISREKLNYINAKSIICRSRATMKSLVDDYKINKSKIFFVPGGANLDINRIDRDNLFNLPKKPSNKDPLILGFIGLDWNRKGGQFLIKLADFFKDKRVPLEIRVIGPEEKKLPKHLSIKYVGFINKSLDLDNFIGEVKSWHFGTLFSKAEAFGISNRECLLLGVPIICHDVGGISSTLPNSNFGKLFQPNPSPSIVYEWIIDILNPYNKYISLRKKLFKNFDEFTWKCSVKNLKDILDN